MPIDGRTALLTDGPALDLPVPKHAGVPADIPDTYAKYHT